MDNENVTATEKNTASESVHLVARNPSEMASSQAHLAVWFTNKVAQCSEEAAQLAAAVDVAKQNKWDFKTLQSQSVRALQRKLFYEKCLAATEAGYTIIPNIPVDVFAIRVKRETPAARMTTTETEHPNNWNGPTLTDENPQLLSVGDGSYQSPVQTVETDRHEKEVNGKKITVRSIWPTAFADIEFPIIAAVPAVMTATQQAMACHIFDEIGVSPQNVRNGDPLIIGHILGPKSGGGQRKTVSFLIAWYLDMRTL